MRHERNRTHLESRGAVAAEDKQWCRMNGGQWPLAEVDILEVFWNRWLRQRTTRTKFGERGFSYSGSAAGNGLLPHLQTV